MLGRLSRCKDITVLPFLTPHSRSLCLTKRSNLSSLIVRPFASLIPSTAVSSVSSSSTVGSAKGKLEELERHAGYDSPDDSFDRNQLDPSTMADPTNRTFSYLMTGSAAFMYASFGRLAVIKFVSYLSASADVMALASMEVDIGHVQEGTATTVKWRGKPVFIRNRTAKEIASAKADDTAALRDPQTDAERFHDNEKWAVLIGVCTHLGCVPINGAGEWGGWFCPCHGSHYDTSGRIRKGPAPLNLAVPQYKFLSDTKILLG